MGNLREFTRPIVGCGAGLHADKARQQCLEELQQPGCAGAASEPVFRFASIPWTWNTFLAISKPMVVTCMSKAP